MSQDRAFVIMQIGPKESTERKRADEIYDFVIAPAVRGQGLEPYRADLDPTPGSITPKMLSELLDARLVIADLTGRNPNVFYELGIAHSFARPLISIADSVASLPFDAKDERVIELGPYTEVGLTYAQGEQAKAYLQESLEIVMQDDYAPPSPLRDLAANRSVDQLAPENPIAAEIAQMREAMEDIRRRMAPRVAVPASARVDLEALRNVVERNVDFLDLMDFELLLDERSSRSQRSWAEELRTQWISRVTTQPLPVNDETLPPKTYDEPPF
jgi:hypothetical protein